MHLATLNSGLAVNLVQRGPEANGPILDSQLGRGFSHPPCSQTLQAFKVFQQRLSVDI